MHTIHIIGIDYERDAWQGHAVRGLRAFWDALDPGNGRSYRDAREAITLFAENPHEARLVGSHEDADQLGAAIAKGLELSENVLTFAVDLEDTALEPPQEDDPNEELFSPAAYKTALVHLAYAGGNATLAWHRSFSMEKATEDSTLWEEVRAVLESAFTHDDEEGPGGPQIVLVP